MTLLLTTPMQASNAVGVSKVHDGPSSIVLLAGQNVNWGGVVSTAVTTCVQGARLLHWSTNSQMRVMVKPHVPVKLDVVMRMFVTTPRVLALQLSITMGTSKFQGVPHSTVLLPMPE